MAWCECGNKLLRRLYIPFVCVQSVAVCAASSIWDKVAVGITNNPIHFHRLALKERWNQKTGKWKMSGQQNKGTLVCGGCDVETLLSVVSVGSQIKLYGIFVFSKLLAICHTAHRNHRPSHLRGVFHSCGATVFSQMRVAFEQRNCFFFRLWICNFHIFYCFTVHFNSLNVTHQLMHLQYSNILRVV